MDLNKILGQFEQKAKELQDLKIDVAKKDFITLNRVTIDKASIVAYEPYIGWFSVGMKVYLSSGQTIKIKDLNKIEL